MLLVDLSGASLDLPRTDSGLTPYSWRGVCRVPGCKRAATDPHHAIPRGRTGGPRRYVILDGQLVGNVIGLCAFYHDRITRGEAGLRWDTQTLAWWYQSPQRGALGTRLLPTGNEGAIRSTGGRYCPHCGRSPARRDPYTHGPQRRRRPLTISVPNDTENGAEIITTLATQVADMIGLTQPDTPTAAYYAITAALTGAVMHPHRLAEYHQPPTPSNGGPPP